MFDVVILAGGLGTRLRSVVSDVPKCMAPVGGRPFLAWILQWLRQYEVNHIILSLGYMNQVVTDWIRNEYKGNIPVDWVIEDTPLGTGGGIKLAMSKVSTGQAIILNGDTFFDVDLNAFSLFSLESRAPLAVALKPMKGFDRYGSVVLSADNRITAFNEKQYCEKGLINGGIYCIDSGSGLFDGKPDRFSFEKDILEKRVPVQPFYADVSDGYFIDIGIPEDYMRAQKELVSC